MENAQVPLRIPCVFLKRYRTPGHTGERHSLSINVFSGAGASVSAPAPRSLQNSHFERMTDTSFFVKYRSFSFYIKPHPKTLSNFASNVPSLGQHRTELVVQM
ncbi:MAG: hypothetical protein IKN55_10480, partial [Oscillospiraceae bacterium]|nr:hypothetical protein [Oscillospiraceae bacterium]